MEAKAFSLTSKSIHGLPAASGAKYRISIGKRAFEISLDLMIFISQPLYLRSLTAKSENDTQRNSLQAIVKFDKEHDEKFSDESAILSFGNLLSLLSKEDSVSFTKDDAKCVACIAQKLENIPLRNEFDELIINGGDFTLRSRILAPFSGLPTASEFSFVFDGKAFSCPRILAFYLSKAALRQFNSSPASNRFELCLSTSETNDKSRKVFASIFNLLNGQLLTISRENADLVLSFAKLLENEEMVVAAENVLFDCSFQSPNGCISFLSRCSDAYECGSIIKACEICSSSFFELEYDDIRPLSLRFIEKILDSKRLKAKSEDQICDFIAKLSDEKRGSVGSLWSKVRFEFLSTGSIEKFAKSVRAENVTPETWSALLARLKCVAVCSAASTDRWTEQRTSDYDSYAEMLDYLKLQSGFHLKYEGRKVVGFKEKPKRKVEIPYGVEEIGKDAFKDSSIISIVLPKTVTRIAERAFEGCRRLKSVKLSKRLKSIGNYAFSGCLSLSEIAIPSKLLEIGEGAFNGCISIKSVAIPESVQSIGAFAFSGCFDLSEAILSSKLTALQSGTFNGCSQLKSIIIPEAVQSIGNEAFNLCSSLEEIEIPWNVSEIPSKAFNQCFKLRKVSIGRNGRIKIIGPYAFNQCGVLTELPNLQWLNEIGDCAFGNCRSLRIQIPEEVTSIGQGAFFRCEGLFGIAIPFAVTEIKSFSFSGCVNLCSVEFPATSKLQSICESAFFECSNLKAISLPESTISIGKCAFSRCLKLKEVFIPPKVTEIKESTFKDCKLLNLMYGCDGLQSLEKMALLGCLGMYQFSEAMMNRFINSGHYIFAAKCGQNFWLFETDSTKKSLISLIKDCEGNAEIPEGIERVDYSQFEGSAFASLKLPSSAKELRLNADWTEVRSFGFADGSLKVGTNWPILRM